MAGGLEGRYFRFFLEHGLEEVHDLGVEGYK